VDGESPESGGGQHVQSACHGKMKMIMEMMDSMIDDHPRIYLDARD
jgi:hypothetical protein